ncbi:hypothetical protein ABTW72_10205 [Micromonospora sp. NPDC127501]|uniref:hypothetical protein n=1 Tax=Micromonospora sp. NPDC127501 TaxID=3154872 RepID=UPI003331E9A4
MGINKPSLCAAFGSKEELFRKAVALRRKGQGVRAGRLRPTDRVPGGRPPAAPERGRRNPNRPAGCLSIQGRHQLLHRERAIAGFLAAGRLGGDGALADRLARAVAEGDLPAHADPVALARSSSAAWCRAAAGGSLQATEKVIVPV